MSCVHLGQTTSYTIYLNDNLRCPMCQTRCSVYTYYIVHTYEVVRKMSYVYILYIARTTSHVQYTMRCRISHVRCRTSCTYDIIRTYDIVGGKNPDAVVSLFSKYNRLDSLELKERNNCFLMIEWISESLFKF